MKAFLRRWWLSKGLKEIRDKNIPGRKNKYKVLRWGVCSRVGGRSELGHGMLWKLWEVLWHFLRVG